MKLTKLTMTKLPKLSHLKYAVLFKFWEQLHFTLICRCANAPLSVLQSKHTLLDCAIFCSSSTFPQQSNAENHEKAHEKYPKTLTWPPCF